jgi:hypothetical protein
MELMGDNLRNLHVPERDARALFADSEFSSILHKSHEVCCLHESFRATLHSELTTNQLALIFQMNVGTVAKSLLRGPQYPKAPGRHRAFGQPSEPELATIFLQAFNKGKAMTRRQVRALDHQPYSPNLTKRWLYAFPGRHFDALQICRCLPQEDTCLTVRREHVGAHIKHMKSILAGKLAEVVFNLDEVGSSDWEEDRTPRTLIATRTMPPDDVDHPVSPRYRYLTLLACLSAGGDALTPMALTSSPT